jgi:uncharacterized protein (TIGR00730 family)
MAVSDGGRHGIDGDPGADDEGSMIRLVEGAEKAFLAGRRRKQADVESAVGIFLELLKGFESFDLTGPCVTIFGSARIGAGDPIHAMARALGRRLAERGFTVITGGGPGLMEAANRGAKDAGGRSIGCNIRLAMEQEPNPFLDQFVEFEHFFVRKAMLIKYSSAFVIMPGGFGTMDEAFEIATLIQTGKLERFPVVAMGREFWEPVRQLFRGAMTERNLIGPADLDPVKLTDDVDEAVAWIVSGMRRPSDLVSSENRGPR